MDIEKSIEYLKNIDPILGNIINEIGIIQLPIPQSAFESLLTSIISQQISTRAAATIKQRVYEAIDYEIKPGKILQTNAEELKAAGLSKQKIKYLNALSEAFLENPHDYHRLHELPDEEVLELLTKIKGIGVWTAQMFMMFNLLRPDIFPVGDLGIRRAMEKHYYDGEPQEHKVLTDKARLWMPQRTVACFYLWKSLKNKD